MAIATKKTNILGNGLPKQFSIAEFPKSHAVWPLKDKIIKKAYASSELLEHQWKNQISTKRFVCDQHFIFHL